MAQEISGAEMHWDSRTIHPHAPYTRTQSMSGTPRYNYNAYIYKSGNHLPPEADRQPLRALGGLREPGALRVSKKLMSYKTYGVVKLYFRITLHSDESQ